MVVSMLLLLLLRTHTWCEMSNVFDRPVIYDGKSQVGLASLRTIETEVEKHVEELLGLFTAEAQGVTRGRESKGRLSIRRNKAKKQKGER